MKIFKLLFLSFTVPLKFEVAFPHIDQNCVELPPETKSTAEKPTHHYLELTCGPEDDLIATDITATAQSPDSGYEIPITDLMMMTTPPPPSCGGPIILDNTTLTSCTKHLSNLGHSNSFSGLDSCGQQQQKLMTRIYSNQAILIDSDEIDSLPADCGKTVL